MPSTRELRRRIKSVKSTSQITKAMEMVAASKMRRAQQRVLAARPYAEKMNEVLSDLAARQPKTEAQHPLLVQRSIHKTAIIHITADRGLCGGLNANMNRRTAAFLLEQSEPTSLVSVGRKGREFMSRYGREISAEFSQLGDYPTLIDTAGIARIVMDDYISGKIDRVFLAYTRFYNTISQRPVINQLLPIQPAVQEEGKHLAEYLYEPNTEEVLSQLLPRYVEMQVYHAILESLASFFSAQMVAMRNATESANEMIDELTLTYNKTRQAGITKELLEIAGGAAALEG